MFGTKVRYKNQRANGRILEVMRRPYHKIAIAVTIDLLNMMEKHNRN